MRQFPFRPLLLLVALALIVVAIRAFACSGDASIEAQNPTLADPSYSDYSSANNQVVLKGFYLNQAGSTEQVAQVFVFMELAAPQSGSAPVDAYVGNSLIRFATIDDKGEYDDVTSSENAALFAEKGYKTAAYGYANSIQGQTLQTKEPTKLMAVFNMDRNALTRDTTVSLWFDVCSAVSNHDSSAISRRNVILDFPAEFVRELPDENAIAKKVAR